MDGSHSPYHRSVPPWHHSICPQCLRYLGKTGSGVAMGNGRLLVSTFMLLWDSWSSPVLLSLGFLYFSLKLPWGSPSKAQHRGWECWVEFSGLTLAPCLGNSFIGKPRECRTPFFSSPFRAKRKVSYAPMAWCAPLEVYATGEWSAGRWLSTSSIIPQRGSCFLIQVNIEPACLPTAKVSVLPPAGTHSWGAGKGNLVIPLPLPHGDFSMKLDWCVHLLIIPGVAALFVAVVNTT